MRHFTLCLSFCAPLADTESERVAQREAILTFREKVHTLFHRLSGEDVSSMDEESLLRLLDGLVNANFSSLRDTQDRDPALPLRRQITDPELSLEVEPEFLSIHRGKEAMTLTTLVAKKLPKTLSLFFLGTLFGHVYDRVDLIGQIPCPFYFQFGFCHPLPSKISEEGRLTRKITLREKQSRTFKFLEKKPSLKEEYEECFAYRSAQERGARVYMGQFSCGLWAAEERRETLVEQAIESFRWGGFELYAPKYRHLPQFLSCLPMSWYGGKESLCHFLRFAKMTRSTLSTEIGYLLPLQGEWWGNSDRGIPLQARGGQLFYWDPFARTGLGRDSSTGKERVNNQVKSFSVCVTGRVGSGKSVFMNDIAMNLLRTGARVFVLEAGKIVRKTL